ncbi:hypothetical protein LJR290_004250 [Variovorax sp. LjRoot290]
MKTEPTNRLHNPTRQGNADHQHLFPTPAFQEIEVPRNRVGPPGQEKTPET